MSFAWWSGPTAMFPGFTSRCRMFLAWTHMRPTATCATTRAAAVGVSGPFSATTLSSVEAPTYSLTT